MAKNPQLEDGYTRIANELFEAILRHGFSQREVLVIFAILRKTYGYGKKEDDMSASQIGAMINKHRNHVTVTINELVKMNVITKKLGNYGMILGLNKSYESWNQASTDSVLGKVVPIRLRASTDSVQVASTDSVHTKENLSKEIQKKASRSEICFDEWIEKTKSEGLKPIPEDHAVFKYADKVGLHIDFIRLCWLEFKTTFAGNRKKRYADWAQAFSNYVRKNYFRLWFEKDGEFQLTTAGIQLKKEMREIA